MNTTTDISSSMEALRKNLVTIAIGERCFDAIARQLAALIKNGDLAVTRA